MHKNKALIAPLGLVGITILSGVFLMSSYSHATSDNTDAVDDVSIKVPKGSVVIISTTNY